MEWLTGEIEHLRKSFTSQISFLEDHEELRIRFQSALINYACIEDSGRYRYDPHMHYEWSVTAVSGIIIGGKNSTAANLSKQRDTWEEHTLGYKLRGLYPSKI
jgi:hypothetical protein